MYILHALYSNRVKFKFRFLWLYITDCMTLTAYSTPKQLPDVERRGHKHILTADTFIAKTTK